MKSFAFILLSLPAVTLSWAPTPRPRTMSFTPSTRLQVSNGADSSFTNAEETVDTPCWQDIWSYDCAMSTAYSAAFVPGDWIKKLPCALGLAVRSLPLTSLTPLTTKGYNHLDLVRSLLIFSWPSYYLQISFEFDFLLSQDCDTPERLNRPAPADGSGVEQVDVMEFLRLKRADPLKKED